jgi:hypothetical protein
MVAQPLNRLLRGAPFTSVTLALALLVLVAAVFWDINVFKLPGADLVGIEQSEIGVERLSVLRATMRTVQDIVGNALMSLYLFRADAERAVSAESLALFDGIITETAAKLKAIADLESVVETHMAIGTGIDYQTSPTIAKP